MPKGQTTENQLFVTIHLHHTVLYREFFLFSGLIPKYSRALWGMQQRTQTNGETAFTAYIDRLTLTEATK